MKIDHRFVKNIPENIEDKILYVSIVYATAIHKCPCGCRNEVVTPFSPTDWELIFNGETISLYPSVGNWTFECRSHYWITCNRVIWAPKWMPRQIERNRKKDNLNKLAYYKTRGSKVINKLLSQFSPLKIK